MGTSWMGLGSVTFCNHNHNWGRGTPPPYFTGEYDGSLGLWYLSLYVLCGGESGSRGGHSEGDQEEESRPHVAGEVTPHPSRSDKTWV